MAITMEELKRKAKAYDEAKYIMKEYLESGNAGVIAENTIKKAFPELAESEDERIRKDIIVLVEDWWDRVNKDNISTKEQMIAWLEKQEGCEYIKKDWLEHIKQSWYKEGFIDGKYSGGTSKEWTINDAAIVKEIIDFLENGTAKLQHDLTKYANWLKSLKDKVQPQPQPKQDWSEEDEHTLQGVIDEIQANKSQAPDYDFETYDRFLSWLKSLKQRIGG